MRKRSTLILIAFLVVATSLSARQKRSPSTPEERTKAVQFAHDLENNPLGPQAKSEREWLLRWVMDVPDITVVFCPQILGTELSDKQPYGTESAHSLCSRKQPSSSKIPIKPRTISLYKLPVY